MSKKWSHILLTTGALLVLCYIVCVLAISTKEQKEAVCHEVQIVVKDSARQGFVQSGELAALLQQQGMYPLGKSIPTINTGQIEVVLGKHPLLKEVECYTTPGHIVVVAVRQRIPKFRIMGGEDYYIDTERHIMPVMAGCAANVPVITGRPSKTFVQEELFDFVDYLENHSFWQSQITQIDVNSQHEICLIPV